MAKITDETVRGYYAQDMKNKIYHEIGRGAWRQQERTDRGKRFEKAEKATVSLASTVRTNLDDLVAEFILSALIAYPQLIEEYEEKLLSFEIKSPKLKELYNALLDLMHEGEVFEEPEELLKFLTDKGFAEVLQKNIELKMLKKQYRDERILEVQLKQLENDIRECARQMENCESFDEAYSRYETLKKERDALLSLQVMD